MIEEIRPHSDSFPSVRFDKAVAGDTFFQVRNLSFSAGVHVTRYTVERVLKRDVVCRDSNGLEKRFNLNFAVHNAFSSGEDPKLQGIIQEEKLRRLRSRAAMIAERASRGRGDAIDDELLDALLAYDKRCEARKDGASNLGDQHGPQ